MSERTIYFDYAATTPVDPRVAARMAECLTADGAFGFDTTEASDAASVRAAASLSSICAGSA